jgi:hypothetical protein
LPDAVVTVLQWWLLDAFQSFCSQFGSIACDRELTAALDLGQATVQRRNQFSQVTECAYSVFTRGLLVRHRAGTILHTR